MRVFKDSVLTNYEKHLVPFVAQNLVEDNNFEERENVIIETIDGYLINLPYTDNVEVFAKPRGRNHQRYSPLYVPIKTVVEKKDDYKLVLYRPTYKELVDKLLSNVKLKFTLENIIIGSFLLGFLETEKEEKTLLKKEELQNRLKVLVSKFDLYESLFPEKESVKTSLKEIHETITYTINSIDDNQFSNDKEDISKKIVRIVSLIMLVSRYLGRMDMKKLYLDVSRLSDWRVHVLRCEFLLGGIISRYNVDKKELQLRMSSYLRDFNIITEVLFDSKTPKTRNLFVQDIKDVTVIDVDTVEVPEEVKHIWLDGVLVREVE